jgi:hypothetical protein
MEEMVKCIEQNYAREGVEIDSTSDEELIVNVPASFVNLSKFCNRMDTEFEATTRLDYANNRAQLVVYIGHLSARPVAAPDPFLSYSTLMWRLLLFMILLFSVQCVSMLYHADSVRTVLSTACVNIATALHDVAYMLA